MKLYIATPINARPEQGFRNKYKAAQKQYFSMRSHEALQKARSLERSVDAYIKRGDDYPKKQNHEPNLFDNED